VNEHQAVNGEPIAVDAKMELSYKQAIERAISHLPAKNGVVSIDSIWVETSIPRDILLALLEREDIELPDRVARINLKSSFPKSSGRSRSRRRRRRPRKRKDKANGSQ